MSKALQPMFVCSQCGYETIKWLGKCPNCGEWNTLEETIVSPGKVSVGKSVARNGFISTRTPPVKLSEISGDTTERRLLTGIGEFDRVLGGGIVRGAVILVGGDPGIGKSTLLTQVAGTLANEYGVALYVSGEESSTQIKLRTRRLGINGDRFLVQNETDVIVIAETIRKVRPVCVVIDSIQTMSAPDSDSSPGSVTQVRSSTAILGDAAREMGVPIFLVGHVNKEGALAGPRVLEHMVDAVLTFEGDRHHAYRILRTAKNRYGSTEEMGLFEMAMEGLAEVPDPSKLLLAERNAANSGSSITATLDGTRPLLIEVQALTTASYLNNPRRVFSGVDSNRMNLILAVLEKRLGFGLSTQDVFINIAGGIRVDEPGADLAVALAVASSFKDIPVEPRTILAGEVGLGGEIRAVANLEKRLREAARLGFKSAIVSSRSAIPPKQSKIAIEVHAVDSLHEAIRLGLATR